RSGVFTKFDFPPLSSGNQWSVTYPATAVQVRVAAPSGNQAYAIRGHVTDTQGKAVAGITVYAESDPSAPNPIRNGSFESPSLAGNQFILYGTGSTNINNWTVVGNPGANIALHSAFLGPAFEGIQYLDPSGGTGGAGISQTFPTTPGQN